MSDRAGAMLMTLSRAAHAGKVRRFLHSPKGYLLVALSLLGLVAAPRAGVPNAITIVAGSVAGAAGMEMLVIRLTEREWRLPCSAVLTGLIIGLILSPQESWLVAAAAGVIATDAKLLLRLDRRHVFNPAAVGLLAVFVVFSTGQSWWGALSELPAPLVALLLTAGYLVADRANKLPAAFAFLGAYAALFTLASTLVQPSYVADIFRPPFVEMALFFGFFMVTDPPTSPVPFGEQLIFGIVVATGSYLAYMLGHGLYYLLVGVLAGNVAYALWRQAGHRLIRTREAIARAEVDEVTAAISLRQTQDPETLRELWGSRR